MTDLRRHLTFANVVAILALFIALGAGAYAAGLGKNSVKSKQIKDGAVQNRDLADGAVSASKLAAGAIGAQVIADGSITGAQIADGSISTAKIAAGAVNGAKIADNSVTGVNVDEATFQDVNAASVGGLKVEKVNFQVPLGSGGPVLILGGLRIDAACVNFGDRLDINATTSKNGTEITLTSMDAIDANDTNGDRDIYSGGFGEFDVGDTYEIDNDLPFGGSNAHFTLNYSAFDGSVVIANLWALEGSPTTNCKLTGIAIGG